MAKNVIPSALDEHIEKVGLKSALEERYLAYALSTIMHRALPDVRDGLKPVHRRIIHAMRLLRLFPDQGYAKCARIVGDVMGKFHPHGDASIYDALVRLAQDFAVRYPLIDGQGNFGNIDGDGAAAMRYTEARMTEVSTLLLEGITENAIDFRPTYNEEDEEPIVLPGAFPNILANGSSGIAVGMATSIPPHNVAELCDAALHIIAHPDATSDDLIQFIPGPDFPTGGILVEPTQSIAESYRTGRGSFRLRSRWHKEEGARGSYVIVVTEIPYQVQKARLIEKTAELLIQRKLPLLEDIRDESAEDIRIVLEPKNRSVDPEILMESLFKLTDFETRISLNLNVLTLGKIPNVLSLDQTLKQWLEHRKEVLIRRTQYRLKEIEKRLELLSGYLIAYLNLDEIIRIIREEDEPKKQLIATFNLTDNQAEAILNMRLRSLRKLEEVEIRTEFDKLTVEKQELEELIASNVRQWKAISSEVSKVKWIFSQNTDLGKRRTSFEKAPDHDIDDIQQAMIEKEPITIVVSEKGWLRALKGHISDYSSLSFKEGDSLKLAFPAQTTDKILVLSTGGKFYTIAANSLPGGRGHGEPIRILVDMDNDQDILTAFVHEADTKLLITSHLGHGFIVPENDVIATTRKGKQVMNVKAPDEAASCIRVNGDSVAIVGENRKLLVFPIEQIAEMSRGKGVRLQRYRDGGMSDIITFNLDDGLTWKDSADRSFVRSKEELIEWIGNRAGAGRMVPKGFPRSGKFN
ncbi:DNA topoisomerase IV subunit A [Bartonella sp. HY329]|uniref:DNA topoisomerase IV subunit A n=1 Tax=unclassified Bartonella TaxID=2645622 RepID=UPI0021C681AA|nr:MULTISPECIES: DNA topoisomerase IV subunit A [unclassified Bartonella]UXM93923.1 DNA topoisomerase IV subunit A [Bartonella sp. HY329]UXN08244.1 DNA topoisomerase IV subunit A [Bartonella sp. HY328]